MMKKEKKEGFKEATGRKKEGRLYSRLFFSCLNRDKDGKAGRCYRLEVRGEKGEL